ncbi:MAG: hypothetical protein ACPHOK_02820, partial [Akkermansiaceae bacterium]
TWKDMGVLDNWGDGTITRDVIETMVGEHGRGGRYHGGGFYEYGEGGIKKIWPGLMDIYYKPDTNLAEQDIKDRLFKGHDQRWAYATFSSFVTQKHRDQGLHFESGAGLDEKQTEAHIQSFLKMLLPIVVSEPGEGYDESLANGKNIGS